MRHSSTTSRCQEDCTKGTRCGFANRGCAGAGGRVGTSGAWTWELWTSVSCNICFIAFLFPDQNKGIRNDISHPQMRGAAATVLFHPDFNRRLRIHTESADPFSLVPPNRVPQKNKALAGLGDATLTAGGDFHPALRTSAARLGNLPESMTKRRLGSKSLQHGDSACSPCAHREPRGLRGVRGLKQQNRGAKVND